MAIGPLETFVFPSVIVRTINDAAGATAAGDIRFPAFVGTSAEEVRVSAFEMVRGSSAISDNIVLEELVTGTAITATSAGWVGGAQGSTNKFRVANFPIVTGDGSGKVATLPSSAVVQVNGQNVAVNAVNGLLGEVTLFSIPTVDDEVRVNYYFKRRDTYIENEDVSVQADSSNTIFKVKSHRIVKGDNSGNSATDADINNTVVILYNPTPLVPGDEVSRTVAAFQVKVNGSAVTVSHIDGANAQCTLAVAPTAGDTVTVTYFTSLWQDTYDILPAASVNRVTKVGLSQDTADYSIGTDCVLGSPNKLHWGTSYQTDTGLYTAGSTPLLNNVVASLADTRVYGRVAAPSSYPVDINGDPVVDTSGNIINLTGNVEFELASIPVTGGGTSIPTEDPTDIIAYVGSTWDAAFTAGPVTVLKIRDNVVTLDTAPSQGLEEKVYVTYYENLIVDDIWTITNNVPGGPAVGKYTISSQLHGYALDVVQTGGTIGSPTYVGAGANSTLVDPLMGSVERVTVTFDGLGDFTVTSLVGPGFVTAGRTGSVTTQNKNKGSLGKTYIDPTTGFRVTFDNLVFAPGLADTVIYALGDPTVSTAAKYYLTAKTDTVRAVPGINLAIATTSGGSFDNTDDTVILSTYNKSGNEPDNGDIYYVTFDKDKTDYTIHFMTSMRDVVKYYGPLDINNKLTIAANLAFLNGAQAVALKQILKNADGSDPAASAYIEGIDAFNEPLPNGLRPTLMQPLSTSSEVQAYLKNSNAIQTSLRYRNERTSLIGFSVGTLSDEVISRVKNLNTELITPVYPDGAIIGITDAYGNEVEYILDGSMIAAAVAGRDVSPVADIATPLTNQTIVGFKRLYRRVDNVTAALIANAGCTVLEEQTPVIRILMYLTCDMSTALTRDPRIVEVKHSIQKGLRNALNRFIGSKNLPKMRPQIQDTVGSYFKSLKLQEIIVDFTGINVTPNATDPSTVDVEAYYSPVFPLNWIMVTLNLRQSL